MSLMLWTVWPPRWNLKNTVGVWVDGNVCSAVINYGGAGVLISHPLLFACYLVVWCIPCARLPSGNRSDDGLVRVWSVSAVKNQYWVMTAEMLSRWFGCTFRYAHYVCTSRCKRSCPLRQKLPNCSALFTTQQVTRPVRIGFYSQQTVGQFSAIM